MACPCGLQHIYIAMEAGAGYRGRGLATQLRARHHNEWYRSRIILQFMSTGCVSGIQRVAKRKVQQRGREMKGIIDSQLHEVLSHP